MKTVIFFLTALLPSASGLACLIRGGLDDGCYEASGMMPVGLESASAAVGYIMDTEDFELANYEGRRLTEEQQAGGVRGQRALYSCPSSLDQCMADTGNNIWFCMFTCGLSRRALEAGDFTAAQLTTMAASARGEFCKATAASACNCDDVEIVCS